MGKKKSKNSSDADYTTIIKSTPANFDKSGWTKANFVVGQTTIIKSTLIKFENQEGQRPILS